jgi:hypothetical protein
MRSGFVQYSASHAAFKISWAAGNRGRVASTFGFAIDLSFLPYVCACPRSADFEKSH